MKWIIREQQKSESQFNAGSKARNDVDAILTRRGFVPLTVNTELDESGNTAKKVLLQFSRYLEWKKCIREIEPRDTVVIQYPVRSHTLLFGNVLKALKKKRARVIGIIHDLESLRLAISASSPALSKMRYRFEELSALKYFDRIIVHNESMKKAVNAFFGIPMYKMVSLEIFDYLYRPVDDEEHAVFGGPVLIAGNLDKKKCGYIYELPVDVDFDLYGANYDPGAGRSGNVRYRGKVDPDELPGVLRGSFGLVWDGPSGNGCRGVFGEYLKYNNPHKTSLYLASGIPVIVWKQSAMAGFVEKHGCGIAVETLSDIRGQLNRLDKTAYQQITDNVKMIRSRLNSGMYTIEAISLTEKKR